MPVVLIVTVEIDSNRIDDFLRVIEEDARGSIEREVGGCLGFEVLHDQSSATRYVFVETYVDDDAIQRHKETEHYKLWVNFKASGGVISQSVIKTNKVF